MLYLPSYTLPVSSLWGTTSTFYVSNTTRCHKQKKITTGKNRLKIRDLESKLLDFRSKQSPVVFHGQPTIVNSPSKSSPDVSKPLKTQSKFPHDDNPKPAASTNNNHQILSVYPRTKTQNQRSQHTSLRSLRSEEANIATAVLLF